MSDKSTSSMLMVQHENLLLLHTGQLLTINVLSILHANVIGFFLLIRKDCIVPPLYLGNWQPGSNM